MGIPMKFRRMTYADLPAVLFIEVRSFPTPWLPEMFIAEMEGPVSNARILEEDGEVVGYATYRIIVDEAHLMNIAIHPDWRSRGRAQWFLERILDHCERQGAGYMFLEVRQSNRAAQGLYRNLGFTLTGRRRGYYVDNGEDALLMRIDLPRRMRQVGKE